MPGTMIDLSELRRLYERHIERLASEYAEALGAAGWDGVLIHSGRPLPRSRFDDQYWPLRTAPYFQHWLPLVREDCAVLVRPGRTPTLYLNTSTSFWEAPAPAESDYFWDSFDVVDVDRPVAIGELVPGDGAIAFVGDDDGRAEAWGFGLDRRNPPALLQELDGVRAKKSAYERACIGEANRRAAAGHEAARAAFAAGDRSELELHLEYLRATQQDASDTPYQNIVAIGANAATLHHVAYGRGRVAGDQSLLVDAGAQFAGYHSDVTRTSVRGDGEAAAAFRALIAAVDGLQHEIVGRVRGGKPYESLHDEAHELLAAVLRGAGIGRASADELVGGGVTRAFLPHGLGHSLGLQTHDVGCRLTPPAERNPFLRNTSVIDDGQVFTIEPGCYFIPALLDGVRAGKHAAAVDWAVVERLAPFGGVRIEDNVAVVDGAAENLTRQHLRD